MQSVIETRGLTKRYGSGDETVTAVDELDLRVGPGEVYGFLGPNGAGKSTTINMLLDFVRPTAGTVRVLGHDVREDGEAVRRRVGVLPEGFGLYDRLSARRHLEFARGWKDADDDLGRLLERVGLSERDAERPVGEYSKGMQQRLAIGMALVGDPELVVLDEPSSGLDPHGIRQMRKLVRDEAAAGTAVFFSSHILGQVEAVCDRVGILYDGELVAEDTVAGLRETVGAGSELHLRVADDVDVNLLDLDGVEAARQTDGILRVTCSASRAKAAVVRRLVDAGIDVIDVDSEGVSLEDVFTAYTTDREHADADVEGRSPRREVAA